MSRLPTHSHPDALAKAWRGLEPQATLPSQSLSWARAATDSFHSDGVVVVSTDGALAPLVLRKGRLEFLGSHEISEPGDLLARDDASRNALASALAATGRPLNLERIPADSPTVRALVQAYGTRARTRPVEGAPFLRLGEGWLDPLAMLTSRRRADLRRAERRAAAEGEVRYEFLAPGPDELAPALDAAWDAESRSWRKERNGTLAQDGLRGPFFRRWARAAAEDGTLRIALMHVGEHSVAMQLATAFAGGYWLLKVGYDEAWARCSPGMLLMADTIRRATEAELETYEFMGVVEPWTHVWTESVRECVTIRAYPLSLGGAAAWLGDVKDAVRARLDRSTP